MTFIMNTQHARALAEEGWTKKDIAEYIYEYARIPAHRHPSYKSTSPMVDQMRWPANPEDPVALVRSPDLIRLLVAGGPGGTGMSMAYGGGGWIKYWVTKKVELPANWDKLVAKYQDIVPTYVRY